MGIDICIRIGIGTMSILKIVVDILQRWVHWVEESVKVTVAVEMGIISFTKQICEGYLVMEVPTVAVGVRWPGVVEVDEVWM